MIKPGDLGRRVRERRAALGLSVEELACRTGMDSGYLHKLESRPSPQLSRETLSKLAHSLETTVHALAGGGRDAPPGATAPAREGVLGLLRTDECQALIGPGGVGRIVFMDERGPVALPVNFRVLNGDVVFRTTPRRSLTSALANGRVSFEVDQLDEALAEGWSVLVTGVGHMIEDQAELEAADALGVKPWAGGDRDVYVRVVPDETTGRRIRRP